MKQDLQDKGLKKALQKPMPYRLSSNFTFRMMLKVDEAMLLKERKQERWMLFALIVASLFLLTSFVAVFTIYWGEELVSTFSYLVRSITGLFQLISHWGIFPLVFLLLILLDYWIRCAHYKRHPKEE